MSRKVSERALSPKGLVSLLAWIAIVLATVALTVGFCALRASNDARRAPVVVTVQPDRVPNGVDLDKLRKTDFTGHLDGATPAWLSRSRQRQELPGCLGQLPRAPRRAGLHHPHAWTGGLARSILPGRWLTALPTLSLFRLRELALPARKPVYLWFWSVHRSRCTHPWSFRVGDKALELRDEILPGVRIASPWVHSCDAFELGRETRPPLGDLLAWVPHRKSCSVPGCGVSRRRGQGAADSFSSDVTKIGLDG
jgi:hypothetical protein